MPLYTPHSQLLVFQGSEHCTGWLIIANQKRSVLFTCFSHKFLSMQRKLCRSSADLNRALITMCKMRTQHLFSCCQFITQDISLTNCSPESIVDQQHTNTNKTLQLSPTTDTMFAWFQKLATENRPLVDTSWSWAADCSVETRSLSVDWILRRC